MRYRRLGLLFTTIAIAFMVFYLARRIQVAAGVLTESSHTSSFVVLSWTNATGGIGAITAQLQRSTAGANSWLIVSGATSSPVTDSELTAAGSYDYRVAYTDSISTTVYSNVITSSTDIAATITTHFIQSSDLWDNGYDNMSSPRQSPYARVVFTTDAAIVTIIGSTTIYSEYPQVAHLGLRINGYNDPRK